MMQVIVALITGYKEEPMVRVFKDRETALRLLSEEFVQPWEEVEEQIYAKTVDELEELNGYFDFKLELLEVK